MHEHHTMKRSHQSVYQQPERLIVLYPVRCQSIIQGYERKTCYKSYRAFGFGTIIYGELHPHNLSQNVMFSSIAASVNPAEASINPAKQKIDFFHLQQLFGTTSILSPCFTWMHTSRIHVNSQNPFSVVFSNLLLPRGFQIST